MKLGAIYHLSSLQSSMTSLLSAWGLALPWCWWPFLDASLSTDCGPRTAAYSVSVSRLSLAVLIRGRICNLPLKQIKL